MTQVKREQSLKDFLVAESNFNGEVNTTLASLVI